MLGALAGVAPNCVGAHGASVDVATRHKLWALRLIFFLVEVTLVDVIYRHRAGHARVRRIGPGGADGVIDVELPHCSQTPRGKGAGVRDLKGAEVLFGIVVVNVDLRIGVETGVLRTSDLIFLFDVLIDFAFY